MPKDAVEVIVLAVGDADSILVTRWKDGKPTRLLIDGGDTATVDSVKARLRAYDATHLDIVLCSHLDDDHAAGLVEIVSDDTFTIDRGYMHIVEKHAALNEIEQTVTSSGIKEAKLVTASVATNDELLQAFRGRNIEPEEPFAGIHLPGFELLVCGPSQAAYDDFVKGLRDRGKLSTMDRLIQESLIEKQASANQPLKLNPKETPANNSSTVIYGWFGKEKWLFTADAGVEAQKSAEDYAKSLGITFTDLFWMQIPHHGSLNAINQERIDLYRPKYADVSADGVGHPKVAVIEAFKKYGTVYGTFRSGNLRTTWGDSDGRVGFGPATPL